MSYLDEAVEAVRAHRTWLANHGHSPEDFIDTEILVVEPFIRRDERANTEQALKGSYLAALTEEKD